MLFALIDSTHHHTHTHIAHTHLKFIIYTHAHAFGWLLRRHDSTVLGFHTFRWKTRYTTNLLCHGNTEKETCEKYIRNSHTQKIHTHNIKSHPPRIYIIYTRYVTLAFAFFFCIGCGKKKNHGAYIKKTKMERCTPTYTAHCYTMHTTESVIFYNHILYNFTFHLSHTCLSRKK